MMTAAGMKGSGARKAKTEPHWISALSSPLVGDETVQLSMTSIGGHGTRNELPR